MHIAGDVPPELSPLDAFAMQSRLLAKQLQDGTKDGNRLSRLPPLTAESPLIQQGRSDYFRSFSYESGSEPGASPAAELPSPAYGMDRDYREIDPEERPKSVHARMSRAPDVPDEPMPPMPALSEDVLRGRTFDSLKGEPSDFGARQERSPSPMHSEGPPGDEPRIEVSPVRRDNSLPMPASRPDSTFDFSPDKTKQASFDDLATKPASFDELGLAPPRAMFPKRSSSIISSPVEDDASSANMASSFHSLPPRKLSNGSAAFANPMASPALGHFQRSERSPSVGSDSSALPRPSFNFSRPMSRSGTPSTFEPPRPSFDAPSRQASSDSQPSFVLADDTVHTPVSMHSDAFNDYMDDKGAAAPSYIYSKFSLPRGKTIQRTEGLEDEQGQASFKWETPMVPPSNVQRIQETPPSPPSRPVSSSSRMADDAASLMSVPRPSTDLRKVSTESARLGVTQPSNLRRASNASDQDRRASEDVPRGRSRTSPSHERPRGRTPASAAGTSDTASTIRPPPTARSGHSASDMTAEEHLSKGIECHENGSLKESTYHLRLAARQNHPTAMLLYALACRHGWGMRANEREGVEWLRKAAEFASVEIADDEDMVKEGKRVDILESKTRKAQFALSIYELGVSHMNGWGIDQDKALALRCFEIAGSKYHPVYW